MARLGKSYRRRSQKCRAYFPSNSDAELLLGQKLLSLLYAGRARSAKTPNFSGGSCWRLTGECREADLFAGSLCSGFRRGSSEIRTTLHFLRAKLIGTNGA